MPEPNPNDPISVASYLLRGWHGHGTGREITSHLRDLDTLVSYTESFLADLDRRPHLPPADIRDELEPTGLGNVAAQEKSSANNGQTTEQSGH